MRHNRTMECYTAMKMNDSLSELTTRIRRDGVHYMHDSIYLKDRNGFVNQSDDVFQRVGD